MKKRRKINQNQLRIKYKLPSKLIHSCFLHTSENGDMLHLYSILVVNKKMWNGRRESISILKEFVKKNCPLCVSALQERINKIKWKLY